VGPVPLGINRFVFQAPCPDVSKIPVNDLIGVTVVLITCSYRSHEFLRIGYYVNNDYDGMTIMADPALTGGDDSMDINISDDEEEEEEDDNEGSDGNDVVVAAGGSSSANENASDAPNNENMDGGADPANAAQVAVPGEGRDANGLVKPQQIVLPRDFDVNKVRRIILDDKPRVTRFAIDWDDEGDVLQQQQVQAAVGVNVASNDMDMDMDL
jgi:hypothetical protein